MKSYIYTEKGAEIRRRYGHDVKAGDLFKRKVPQSTLHSYIKAGLVAVK